MEGINTRQEKDRCAEDYQNTCSSSGMLLLSADFDRIRTTAEYVVEGIRKKEGKEDQTQKNKDRERRERN